MSGLWLAIDSATDLASVAVGTPPLARGAAFVQGARQHAAQILALIDQVLAPTGVRPKELEGIGLGDGPGSFTGLRIGWAAAKGLAQEAGLSLRTVPSLMAAAAGAARLLGAVPIAACFDALRGQVYGAVYIVRLDVIETLLPPTLATIDELAARAPVRPRAVVGDGATHYAAEVQRWSGAAPVPLEELVPPAVSILALLDRKGAAGAITDPATAEPVYGRPAEAQAKWEARHGRPLPHPSRRGS